MDATTWAFVLKISIFKLVPQPSPVDRILSKKRCFGDKRGPKTGNTWEETSFERMTRTPMPLKPTYDLVKLWPDQARPVTWFPQKVVAEKGIPHPISRFLSGSVICPGIICEIPQYHGAKRSSHQLYTQNTWCMSIGEGHEGVSKWNHVQFWQCQILWRDLTKWPHVLDSRKKHYNRAPENRPSPKRKGSSSNHHFSGASC